MSEHIDRPGEVGDGRVSASVVAQVNLTELRAAKFSTWDVVTLRDGGRSLFELDATEAVLALVEAVAQLQDVHEFQCGCDDPGNASLCVAAPRACFEALRPFAAASVPQKEPGGGA